MKYIFIIILFILYLPILFFSDPDPVTDVSDVHLHDDDFYSSDPALFKDIQLTPEIVRKLIIEGPCQPGLNDNFSKFPVVKERKFNISWYYIKDTQKTSRSVIRDWLIYSPRAKKMFCFCCFLFEEAFNKSVWANPNHGFGNFKKATEKIRLHENSESHKKNQIKFILTKLRISKNSTVIEEHLFAEKIEVQKNRDTLTRIFDIILYLAKQNLPLRGHREVE